ncbi:MAG TPA: S41 family peptidase [Longimicrobiales bacterium]|nr:S41 family peptidase [Longimicrobiales bacterium]
MKINRTVMAPVLVAVTAMATGGWFLQRGMGQEQNVYANARLFEDVLQFVAESFVDEKEPAQLYRMAVDGMLEELGDPHTSLMLAEDYENLRLQTQGEYGGIGVSIDRRGGWITVISPLPGTPGERAGLQAGDQIIEVDGESTRDWDTDLAVSKLRGPEGEPVDILIARGGVGEPIPIRIVREEIHLQAVPSAYMLDGNVGYVELTSFSESSTRELRDAIAELRSNGARGMILDLRGNPGGLLDQGVMVADLFLDRGETVVETKGRAENQNQRAVARTADQFPDLPVVVLVGPQSASASEIVAGALQDHDRALVLGRTTYGKGSVQSLYPLENNNWLKITTARWYTPSGRSIQKPYGIDAHLVEDDIGEAAPEDTTERPEYETDSGRTVYGGGGIHPDVVLPPDTTTLEERRFVQAMQQHFSDYIAARLNFAVTYLRENPGLQPGFEVTPAMLDRFYTTIVDGGVEVDRELYDNASRWLANDLGVEITLSKWGQEAARRRTNAGDPQVKAAADMLRRATTPESLFALAQSFRAPGRSAPEPESAPAMR